MIDVDETDATSPASAGAASHELDEVWADPIEWLIRHRSEQLLPDGASRWLQGPRRERARAAWIDRSIFGHWQRKLLASISPDLDLLDWARAATDAVRSGFLSQRQIQIEFRENVMQPGFPFLAGSRVVRGMSNCEGINHALVSILSTRLPSAKLYETEEQDGFSHTLAGFGFRGDLVLADAWADVPLFAPKAAPDPRIPSVDALHRSGLGQRQGIYPSEMYLRLRAIGDGRDWLTQPSAWTRFLGAAPERSEPAQIPLGWEPFLEGRKQHLLERKEAAERAYREAIASGGPEWLRYAARHFAAAIA